MALAIALAAVAGGPSYAQSVQTATVTGTLVTVADAKTPDSRVLTADGSFVPVEADKIKGVAPGSTVRVTVDRRGITRADASAERRLAPKTGSTGTTSPTGSTGSTAAANPTGTTVVAPAVGAALTPSTQTVTAAIVVPAGVRAPPRPRHRCVRRSPRPTSTGPSSRAAPSTSASPRSPGRST